MMNSENGTKINGVDLQEMYDDRKKSSTGKFIKGFVCGVIAMAIIFTTVNIIMPLSETYAYDHPTLKIVTCPLSFTDINGLTIAKNVNDQWELTADQDVLVWFDLPSDIEQLDANIKSSYPYMVKAGEQGTITMEVFNSDNSTKYVGTLDFIAADDLTIGAVQHGFNLRNREVGVGNDTARRFSWMEEGKHAYVHYPLYTSCSGKYNVYQIQGDKSSVGYDVYYDIVATNAPQMSHISMYPDGDISKEPYKRTPGPKPSIKKNPGPEPNTNKSDASLEPCLNGRNGQVGGGPNSSNAGGDN